jgi:two-component system sensor histidine kinase KdpD
MLSEARRRAARGTDVVVVVADVKGRPNTAAQLDGLEILGVRGSTGRPTALGFDVDAVLRRRPDVALVDDYAHGNNPGRQPAVRWVEVEMLLEAGIEVITTLNIQHMESLVDVVSTITGAPEPETIPDAVVRRADQIELIDVSPEALRRRMAHGNIYPPERIDGALSHYFRLENLGALRELALEWMAEHVDRRLAGYRATEGIADPWETRERVVVALTGAPGGERLLRRGARVAARANAELLAVHVRGEHEAHDPLPARFDGYRDLAAGLGGQFTTITGRRVADSLVAFARAENATQLLVGATRRSQFREMIGGSVVKEILREAGPIDVHVVSTARGDQAHRYGHRPDPGLARSRRRVGWLLALGGTPLLVFALLPLRAGSSSLPAVLLLLLLGTVVVAAVGGLRPGLTSAFVAVGLADWYFVPPVHTWRVAHPRDAVVLVAFVAVAGTVSLLTDRLALRAHEVRRSRAEAATLTELATRSIAPNADALTELVEQVHTTFGVDAVALLTPSERGWSVEAATGSAMPGCPGAADLLLELSGGSALALRGAEHLSADERRLLNAFGSQLRLAQQQLLLQADAASAVSLAEANRLRTAMLAAVSHDLRTPLASIKAAATSVLSTEVTWTPEAIQGFCETIDLEADRLNTLVGNLLDMSRLQAGALSITLRPTGLDEVTFSAIKSLSRDTTGLDLGVSESLPPIVADPALLERAVANVIDNALNWSPERATVRVEADTLAGHAELRVVDRGPGIPLVKRATVFQPFQRLGDGPSAQQHGVGLGLAVARGFVETMGGELRLEDTPGGGLTTVFTFPIA